MKLFDVYPLYEVTPVSAKGIEVIDDKGEKYHDFYGGHAVISIGHSHPHYVQQLTKQLEKMAFYSNSIQNPLQQELAEKVGTTKNYIPRIENNASDIRLSTLMRIIREGLGGSLKLSLDI